MHRSGKIMLRIVGVLAAAFTASLAQAQVDYRHAQSPVKDQGARGTCVAFSICAAMETFPGVPTDLSEQLLYATVKRHQQAVDRWLRMKGRETTIREGDDFLAYVSLFELVGTCPEQFLPYNPSPLRVGSKTPPEVRRYIELAQIDEATLESVRDAAGKYGFRADQRRVLDASEAKSVGAIKAALHAGVLAIPVTYVVHEKPWSDLPNHANFRGDGVRDIIHPGMLERFAPARGEPGGPSGTQWVDYNRATLMAGGDGLAAAIREGRWRRRAIYPQDQYSGHAVTIVGYDEIGFIIKNSWGTGWGRGGYARVAFDYHELYATSALLLTGVRIREPHLSPFAARAFIQRADWRLKAQRSGPADDGRLTLSSWAMELRDPDVGAIEYTVEGRDDRGNWATLLTERAASGDLADRAGTPLVLEGDRYRRAMGCVELRVRARYAMLRHSEPLDAAVFVATRSFPAFNPRLSSAIDLEPR